MTDYLKTSLHSFHTNSCAKMAPFAGYDMPIQYPTGVLKEHNWVRESSGIFDVSHMGQYILSGAKSADFLSYITPSPFKNTSLLKCKYTVLTNDTGGIIDDLIVTRLTEDTFYIVLNAACKENDIKWITQHLPKECTLTPLDKSLIAIQGPKTLEILQKHIDYNLNDIPFMSAKEITINNTEVVITRSGYTGEDGFEISVSHEGATNLWQLLLKEENILPIGLAARDSLRLEAGFPLYGHDLDETTSPIEANLAWIVSKKNTSFIGAERIINERDNNAKRYRIGIELLGKGIAREGSKILNKEGAEIGVLTSGTFSPTLKKSIGQGYIQQQYASVGTQIYINIRGNNISALTHSLSFIKSKTTSTNKRNEK